MKRRDFIKSVGAAMVAPVIKQTDHSSSNNSLELIRPRALSPGDTVGLITPATYVADSDRLAIVERTINYFGLRMKLGKNVRKRTGYLGGTIDERLDDLHEMFRDKEVQAIFAIRGGYGCAQLLDRIDYDLVRKNPKIFLGYSDI